MWHVMNICKTQVTRQRQRYKGDLLRIRLRYTLETRSKEGKYTFNSCASFAFPRAHEEVISFRVLGQVTWIVGNSTAAREKYHANAIQIGTMLRTCEVRVSASDATRDRADLFIPL